MVEHIMLLHIQTSFILTGPANITGPIRPQMTLKNAMTKYIPILHIRIIIILTGSTQCKGALYISNLIIFASLG